MAFTEALKKYREGLEELLFVAPTFGTLARALGTPVWDTEQPTAYVTYDEEQKSILFAFNPDFIVTLSDEEAAAVIAHETHHVVLEHLDDVFNPVYRDQNALTKAQECIINDTVESVLQLPLPDFVMRGEKLAGQNCADLSTFQAYKLFEQEKNDKESDAGEQNDSSAQDGQNSPKASSGSPGASSDAQAEGACGGMQMPASAQEAVGKIVKDAVKVVADELDTTVEAVMDAIAGTPQEQGYSPTGAPVVQAGEISSSRMNWQHLLARINPKVLSSGSPRVRTQYDWTRTNRRLAGMDRRLRLPVARPVKPKKNDEGDKLPTMVIALDLSGSIPRTLVKTLQSMLNEIPEELIQAFPCTWGSNLLPYRDGGNVAGGGTNIFNVVNYVEKIARETSTEPYVLVITDGQFTSDHRRPGKEWIWMSVDKASLPTFKGRYYGNTPHAQPDEEVYLVNDFKI